MSSCGQQTKKNQKFKAVPAKHVRRPRRAKNAKRPAPLSNAEDLAIRNKIAATLDLDAVTSIMEKNADAMKEFWETPD